MKRTFALLLIAVMLICSMSSVAAIAEEKTTFIFATGTSNEPAFLSQLQGGTGDYFNNAYLLQAPLFRNNNGMYGKRAVRRLHC